MSQPQFTILYDGECPLCLREIRLMRRLDAGRGQLDAIDISSPEFDPILYQRSWETLMGKIHGVLPDGRVIEGVEVFRRSYAAVGRGWVMSWTAWPLLRPVADAAYRWFARNRLSLTGRRDACASGSCARTRKDEAA